jgi:GrpB-like predicted nucleotidyltransferase (UPF0157 family)
VVVVIEIVPYRGSWAREFAEIGAAMRLAVGDGALSIHHIGSTSVPGLDAKDVIDVQMTVGDLDTPIRGALEGIGYNMVDRIVCDHCPPGMTLEPAELDKRLFGFSGRRIHLHVRQVGRFNQRYPLLCRDYLRSHPFAAQAYGEIKRQLARYFPENVEAYYDVKDPVFDVLMAGAEEWASVTGWSVPGTDV